MAGLCGGGVWGTIPCKTPADILSGALSAVIDGLMPLFIGVGTTAVVAILVVFAVRQIRFAAWLNSYSVQLENAGPSYQTRMTFSLMEFDRARFAERVVRRPDLGDGRRWASWDL